MILVSIFSMSTVNIAISVISGPISAGTIRLISYRVPKDPVILPIYSNQGKKKKIEP